MDKYPSQERGNTRLYLLCYHAGDELGCSLVTWLWYPELRVTGTLAAVGQMGLIAARLDDKLGTV